MQNSSQEPLTIQSGSVIVRFHGLFSDKLKRVEDGGFAFTLGDISLQSSFPSDTLIEQTATIVIPDGLEFTTPASGYANNQRAKQRTISETTTAKQALRHTVSFRKVDFDRDGVADLYDLCPDSDATAIVDLRGCEPDADSDGISDLVDMCPGSTTNALVDERGCEPDSDQDGLPDRYDQCDNTPEQYPVGEDGCALDGDGDGIIDALDKCPASEPAEPVAQNGCSLDFDSDGVPNHRDRCNATARGREIDSNGCEVDSDADGIVDRLDVCPNSAADILVNNAGCAIDDDLDGVPDYRDICLQTSEKPANDNVNSANTSSLGAPDSPALGCDAATDHVILEQIEFPSESSMLSVESRNVLDRVARAIEAAASSTFEIGAHTVAGNANANQSLSQARADTVRQYLMVRGVSPNRITAKGYGESRPIVAGSPSNDRVELTRLAN